MAVCTVRKNFVWNFLRMTIYRYVLKINNLYLEDDEKFQGAKFHTANWDKSVSIKALKTMFHNFSYVIVNQNCRIPFRNCFRKPWYVRFFSSAWMLVPFFLAFTISISLKTAEWSKALPMNLTRCFFKLLDFLP